MKKVRGIWKNTNLIVKVIFGIVIGAVLGMTLPDVAVVGYFGTVFVNALKAVAPVLVFLLVMSSISNANKGVGSEFRNVIILYLLSTLLSAVIAVIVHILFPLTVKLSAEVAEMSAPRSIAAIFGNLVKSIVENPVSAISTGNYPAILFWAVIMGMAMRMVAGETTIKVIEDISDATSKVVGWIIQCAPFGIMGIVFTTVADNGLSIFSTYGLLIVELVLAMLFVMLVANPLIVFVCTHENPYPLVFKCIRKSAVSAFFTRSSAANIPVNMELCEELGLNKDFYAVSIPLGSTVNMDGAAIVITIMALTLANTLGIKVPVPMMFLLAIISTLGACGASGVAGGSLLLIPMACSMLGISNDLAMQMVSVGFVIGVIQDSTETALNSSADVVFTATAEKMEKRKAAKRAAKAKK